METRAAELARIVELVRASKEAFSLLFGPRRASGTRAFAFGGVVTDDEYAMIRAATFKPRQGQPT